MTAPDKIYLATTEEVQNLDNSFVGIAHSNPEDIIEPIEYVRKNAFIERVINFLNYKLDGIVATRVSGTIIPHHVAKQELIEDLEKYMKG